MYLYTKKYEVYVPFEKQQYTKTVIILLRTHNSL